MPSPSSSDPAVLLREGIVACRERRWREGYDQLARLAAMVERRGNMPGMFYSYLGVAMARCEGRRREGVELCRYAVRLEPNKAENHANLGWLYLMESQRSLAWRSLERALAVEPRNPYLRALHEELGVRRPPVFTFLSRGNPINILAGQLRSRFEPMRERWQEWREESRERKSGPPAV